MHGACVVCRTVASALPVYMGRTKPPSSVSATTSVIGALFSSPAARGTTSRPKLVAGPTKNATLRLRTRAHVSARGGSAGGEVASHARAAQVRHKRSQWLSQAVLQHRRVREQHAAHAGARRRGFGGAAHGIACACHQQR